MVQISQNSKISVFSYETAWTKTVRSNGAETIIYTVNQSDKPLDYVVSDRAFRVKDRCHECQNPISVLMEMVDTTNERKNKELIVQQFFQRFGFFNSRRHEKVSHDEIVQIAYHYRLLIAILKEYYQVHKDYAELFSKCIEYYLLHSKFLKYRNMTALEGEDDFFHSLYQSFPIVFDRPKLHEIEKALEVEEKCRITGSFLSSSTNLSETVYKKMEWDRQFANTAVILDDMAIPSVKDIEEILKNQIKAEAAGTGTKMEPIIPEILQLMNSVYEKFPYYIDKGKVYFKSEEDRDKAAASHRAIIKKVAATTIKHAIGSMNMKMVFDVEESIGYIEIDNLKSLIDYSLLLMNHKNYGYYPCSNPKCSRYVLKRRPEQRKTDNKDFLRPGDKEQSHFCSQICARRIAQQKYMLRQNKNIGG